MVPLDTFRIQSDSMMRQTLERDSQVQSLEDVSGHLLHSYLLVNGTTRNARYHNEEQAISHCVK